MSTAAPDDCQKKSKKAFELNLCKIARQGGEPAFTAAKESWNAFIGEIGGIASATADVMEPLLTIDKFIIDNFVEPPLLAALTTLEAADKAIKIPLKLIGAADNSCKSTKRVKNAMDTATKALTFDFDKLKNTIDAMDEYTGDRTELIADLRAVPDAINALAITDDYETFIAKCPTT